MLNSKGSKKFAYLWLSACIAVSLSILGVSSAIAANFSQVGVSSPTCQLSHPTITLSDFELGGNGVITVTSDPNSIVYLFGAPEQNFLLPNGFQIANFIAYLSATNGMASFSLTTDSNGHAQTSFPISNNLNFI